MKNWHCYCILQCVQRPHSRLRMPRNEMLQDVWIGLVFVEANTKSFVISKKLNFFIVSAIFPGVLCETTNAFHMSASTKRQIAHSNRWYFFPRNQCFFSHFIWIKTVDNNFDRCHEPFITIYIQIDHTCYQK